MTRIIAGEFGGRRIDVPPSGTRPTTDRVREAIFSRLESDAVIDGAVVLDAFAGSGALGLEALSRGAKRATFVDANPAACRIVRANAATLGATSSVVVVRDAAARYLAAVPEAFTLVFLDPPYDLPPRAVAETLAALELRLAAGATVVFEASTRAPDPEWPASIHGLGSKTYGSTRVHFATRGSEL